STNCPPAWSPPSPDLFTGIPHILYQPSKGLTLQRHGRRRPAIHDFLYGASKVVDGPPARAMTWVQRRGSIFSTVGMTWQHRPARYAGRGDTMSHTSGPKY